MKPQKMKPSWALWIGFVVAPLACALNAALLEAFVSDSPIKTGEWLPIGLLTTFITGPQGGATYGLLQLCQTGNYRAARGLSLACALVAPLFYLWCWHGLEMKMQWGRRAAAPMFGALFLPVLWSLLFLLFALLGRARKP